VDIDEYNSFLSDLRAQRDRESRFWWGCFFKYAFLPGSVLTFFLWVGLDGGIDWLASCAGWGLIILMPFAIFFYKAATFIHPDPERGGYQ